MVDSEILFIKRRTKNDKKYYENVKANPEKYARHLEIRKLWRREYYIQMKEENGLRYEKYLRRQRERYHEKVALEKLQ
jgi:hypothetical protein